MRERRTSLLVTAVLAVLAAPVESQDRWTGTGPACERVLSIAEGAGSSLYLVSGTFRGHVFGSTDAGQSWREIGPRGPARGGFQVVTAHADRPGTLFAGHDYLGVFSSRSDGAGWKRIRKLPKERALDVIISPARPGDVFALVSVGGEQVGRLYRSSDGGDRWANVSPRGGVSAFTVHPEQPDRLLAAVRGTGIFSSSDGGASWTQAALSPDETEVQRLAYAPSDPNTAYASTGTALYSTTDGSHWRFESTAPGAASAFTSLDVDPRRPRHLLAGLFHIGNEGAGVLRSRNGGRTWRRSRADNRSVLSLLWSRVRGNAVYAGTETGFSRGNRKGKRWRTLESGLATAQVGLLAASEPSTGSSRIYATSQCSWTPTFYREESEAEWRGSEQDAVALAVSPADSKTVYSALGSEVSVSLDGGVSWSALGSVDGTPVLVLSVNDLTIDPANPDRLFAGLADAGLSVSTDGGVNWNGVDGIGLPLVYGVSISPSRPRTIYAWGGGVARSTDGGSSWEVRSQRIGPAGELLDLIVDPRKPATVFAVCPWDPGSDPCVFRSTDGGRSWTSMATGLPRGEVALVADPDQAATLYAAVGNQVLQSSDRGRSWTALGNNLGDRLAGPIALSATRVLHVGTDRGVLTLPLEP